MAAEKAPALQEALAFLLRRFGDRVAIVDHWKGDLLAVGIARRDDNQKLAYLSVRPELSPGAFFVALEDPPTPQGDMPYADMGSHENLTLDEAAVLIARHLGLS